MSSIIDGSIQGVKIKQLVTHADERGKIVELLRSDENFFQKFGQCYLCTVRSGIVKGYHYHKKQTDFFTVVKGMIKLVLYDQRENSPTKYEIEEIVMGDENLITVSIPPFVVHGIKNIGVEDAFLINNATEPYFGDEKRKDEFRINWNDPAIPYDWKKSSWR